MSAFSDAVSALSPTIYWRFGEASGTIADIASGRHLLMYGSPTYEVAGEIAGDTDTAVEFNVPAFSSDYGRSQFTYNLYAGATQFTWLMRLRFTDDSNYVFAQVAGSDNIVIQIDSATTVRLFGLIGGNTMDVTSQSHDFSDWRMVAFVFDAGTLKVYVDGVEDASVSTAITALFSSTQYMYVARNVTSAYYEGALDEFAMFRGIALTPTEILDLFVAAGGTPPTPPAQVSARSYLRVNMSGAVSSRAYLRVNTASVRARSFLSVNTRAPVSARAYLRVDTDTDFSVAQRPGVNWEIRLTIGGVDCTHLATGAIRTDWSKGKSFVANFDLMPAEGVLDPADFDGQAVVIEYRDITPGGVLNYMLPIYRGNIARVTWLPPQGILRCSATTNSDARFRVMEQDEIAREIGGEWSRYVFNASARGWDHVRDRLETLQADLWFMADGGVMFKPWASAAADVEWADADVLPDSLRHEPALRSGITNRIEVRMDYRFQRLRQRMLRATWSTGVTWCHRLQYPFPLCQRSMIEDAARGSGGWQLVGDVTFEAIPNPGAYPCFPFAVGDAKYILWGGDADAIWAWSAKWTAARRWAQEITERYSAELVAQASVDANGLLEQVDEYGVESEKDSSDWLGERGYKSAGSGFVSASAGASDGSGTVLGDQVKNADADGPGNRADFEQAQRAAFAAAAAEIVAGHRHTVTAASVFDPRIKPGVTLRLNTVKLRATGHLVARREVFDMNTGRATTEADIGPFVVDGTGIASPSALDPIAQPELPEEADIPSGVSFPTHIGGLTTSPFLDEDWTGYLTNYEYDPTNTEPFAANPVDIGDRVYPDQFTVEYPDLAPAHLAAIETTAERRIDVDIPSDELVRIQ